MPAVTLTQSVGKGTFHTVLFCMRSLPFPSAGDRDWMTGHKSRARCQGTIWGARVAPWGWFHSSSDYSWDLRRGSDPPFNNWALPQLNFLVWPLFLGGEEPRGKRAPPPICLIISKLDTFSPWGHIWKISSPPLEQFTWRKWSNQLMKVLTKARISVQSPKFGKSLSILL